MQIIQYGAIKELGSTVLDFQVALVVKNPSAIIGDIDMWIPSLGQEDPLEKGMATHSSILAWKIPWTEEPGRLHSIVSQRVRHDWSDLAHTHPVSQAFYR